MDYTGLIVPILAIVDGLLFGLAIKKGIVSFVLLLIAFVISSYIGFTFVLNHTITAFANTIVNFITSNAQSFAALVPIGNLGSISLLAVLFFVGLGIGIWKG